MKIPKDIKKLETNLYIDGDIVPIVENSQDIFLHKSTILYGSSGSGKTVLIKHILYLLKDNIPQVVIINPTNKLNNAYSSIVPKQLIYDEIDENLFKIIYDKQAMGRQIYDKVQKIEPLYILFKKCATYDELGHYKKMCVIYEETKNEVDMKVRHIIDKKKQQTQLSESHQKETRKFFQQTIRKNNKVFESDDMKYKISKDERQIIKYLDYNPNLLLIFDDCAASFKNWGKSTGVKELFFNGRHFYVTTIMSFQTDTILPPDLRSNAFISIFTTKQCALSFFENKKNGISKSDHKKYTKYVEEIFKSKDSGGNYQKLCYFKNSTNYVIQYIMANVYDEFRFGCKSLWDYCDQIKSNNAEVDINNPFYESFNN
jgi:energy-coupling factor transporter ATP-binding protein EcfA2